MDTWCNTGAGRNIKAALLERAKWKLSSLEIVQSEERISGESGIDNPSESWDDFDVRSRESSSLSGKGVIAERTVFERPDEIRTARRRSGASERIRSRRGRARLAKPLLPRNELRSLESGSYGWEGNTGKQHIASFLPFFPRISVPSSFSVMIPASR